MNNTLVNNTESLVQQFQKIDPEKPYWAKYHLCQELQNLLNYEVSGSLSQGEEVKLKEFRDNFTWEETYYVKTEYDICSSLTKSIPCNTKGLMESYLKGEVELPQSHEELAELDEYYMDDLETEIYGVKHKIPCINVYNLELKPESERITSNEINWKNVLSTLTNTLEKSSLKESVKQKLVVDFKEQIIKEMVGE